MKALLGVVLVAAMFGGGLWVHLDKQKAAERAGQYQQQLGTLKREFLIKSKGLALLDGDAYKNEVAIALTQYFAALEKLGKDFPEHYDVQREKVRIAAEVQRGRMKADQKTQYDERIDLTLGLFESMKNGQYKPLYSASDKTFRFDIYDIQPEDVGGQKQLRVSYVHWGAFGPVSYKSIHGTFLTQAQMQAAAKAAAAPAPVEEPKKGGKAEAKDETPEEITQIVGSDQPPTLQVEPERWVAEFIPGVEIGYYYLPLFPREAAGLDLSFGFGLRTFGGSEVYAQTKFPTMVIADAWKLAPGQKWDAKESVLAEEDMRAAAGKGK